LEALKGVGAGLAVAQYQSLWRSRAHGHGYIGGRNRRHCGEVFDYIQSATGVECPLGITAREKATPPKTLEQEVASQTPGVGLCRPIRRPPSLMSAPNAKKGR
jgi:hypothetical protein